MYIVQLHIGDQADVPVCSAARYCPENLHSVRTYGVKKHVKKQFLKIYFDSDEVVLNVLVLLYT